MSRPDLPGFRTIRRGADRLVVAEENWPAMQTAGLADPAAWVAAVASGETNAGRGSIARVDLPGGRRLWLKQLRRGGLLAGLWRGCFAGRGRLEANVHLAAEARRRGIRTPAVAGLLVRRVVPGLYRGWLAVRDVAGAEPLSRVLTGDPGADAEGLRAAAAAVRAAHDLGLEHRDLNLGNLLRGTDGEVTIIDLDRGSLHAGDIPLAVRRSALERIARSYVKIFRGEAAVGDRVFAALADGYAHGDAALAGMLAAGGRSRSWRFAAHRATWSRGD